MSERIDLLKEYITKEAEMFEIPQEETLSYERVKAFLEYRDVRVKQAWYAQINAGEVSRSRATEMNKLDHERRLKHNAALHAMLGFDLVATKLDLPPLYTGRKMTEEEIESHAISKLDVRKEMTDWFLDMVHEIEDLTASEYLREDKSNSFIDSLKKDIYDFDRAYGVEENLLEDDGDIKFKKEDVDPYTI